MLFMKRPWQIWLLFFIGLVVVLPSMAWLTLKALELDQAESIARRQAELEEDVSRALWRMDALLTPLLAEEAARPDFVYRPLYTTLQNGAGKGALQRTISPLLAQPPEFVLLHFEIHADGRIVSPQCPTGEQSHWALANGGSAEVVAEAQRRMEQLRGALSYTSLLNDLPDQSLPYLAMNLPMWENTLNPNPGTTVIANSYGPPNQAAQQSLPSQEDSTAANAPAQQAVQQALPLNAAPDDNISARGSQTTSQSYGVPIESGRLQRAQSRLGNDLQNRDAAYQAYAQRAVVEQRQNPREVAEAAQVVEGVSRPLWIGPYLILARRVQMGDETLIQGCWLDWEKLRERLRAEVADLLPQVQIEPVKSTEPLKLSRLLATIPVQLSVPPPIAQPAVFSPIRTSLLVAWGCLIVAVLVAAAMLQSIITLSERRAAFVAAVTHELRTPLTTFRMYAEMLAEGMVPAAEQRQAYLETLRVEADRLHHLVENVLQYARLERGRPGRARETTALGALISRVQTRLADRAEQAQMKLVVEMDESAAESLVQTDSAAVEQILFNLIDNACKYAAPADDRRIHLEVAAEQNRCRISVRDHGPGISPAGRRKLFQPFSKSVHEAASTAPGVGLGLALSRRLARDLGGKLEYASAAEAGAAFALTLPR